MIPASLLHRAATACTPPDRRPVYEWARDHVQLPGAFTITGQFNADLSRNLLAVFDALQDDLVRSVTLVKPTRGGGSLVADVWLPWIIANDPGPAMWTHQTDKIAEDMAETRLMPILNHCRPVAALFPEDRHAKRKTEIIFSNGMPLYVQGPSIANLQSKGIRYLINSELWMWKPGRHADALARVGDFEQIQNSKVFNESQAGIEDDDLDLAYKAGSQSEWHIPCLSCGHFMPLKWTAHRPDGTRWGMVWDDNERTRDTEGNFIKSEVIASVRFECEQCGHPHPDSARTRAEWNRLGKYVALNPRASRRDASFHFNALILRDWSKLVAKWIDALEAYRRGVWEPLVEFTQKELAEPWAELRVQLGQPHTAVNYEVNSEWPDESARFLTVDVQSEGVFWAVIRAWSKSGESRRLWFGKLFSFAEVRDKQLAFRVRDNHTLLDSGFEAKEVYFQCVKFGWIALKGEDRRSFTHKVKRAGRIEYVLRSYSEPSKGDPEKGTVIAGRRFAHLIRWSVPTIADRLKRLRDGKGAKWLVPSVTGEEQIVSEEEYNRQMSAEYKKQKVNRVTGRREWIWVCPSGNNHLSDAERMNVVAATILNLLPDSEPAEPPSFSPTA
jgi:hypothetical protein